MGPIDFLVETFMIPFLKFSYANIYGNYAIAIIILTVLIKMALYPLTHKQFASMKTMQKLQPELKKIKDKFKKDPQRLQQEMIKLYQVHKVNPLSGCLPMLVQLPFLFALFYTMSSESFKTLLSSATFPGLSNWWLPNLTQPDHLFILPILIGVATFYSQKFSPVSDPQQQKIMQFMPLLMMAICFKMPAGVLLYWASSQIISTFQQMHIMKQQPQGA